MSSSSHASQPSGAGASGPRRGTVAIVDAVEALIATEQLCARALWAPESAHRDKASAENAFGETVERLGGDPHDARAALAACERSASRGGRVAAVVSAAALADARRELIGLVERRRPVVVHVIVAPKGSEPRLSDYADVHAVADVGAAILYARDAQDASDLVVIAHRAADDAEAPCVVVHDGYPASHARERVLLPDAPMVRAALEAAPPHLGAAVDVALPPHRRAAARVPFALSSAMRAFERLSGRRRSAIEAFHLHDAELALLAAGSIAETARAVVEHLRAATPSVPVGLVQLTTLRPFPGAELVKALSRVRACAVVERIDAPLAQSNPLAVEVKAAFADALTWAPGYPGIGRIPNIYAGCVEPSVAEATPGDLMAIIDNVLQGELGRRVFHVGASHPHEGLLPVVAEQHVHPDEAFAVRWTGDPSLFVHLLADLYGAHVRATPRLLDGVGEVFDVTASPFPVRAHHGASALDVVFLGRSERADLEALAELREGGVAIVAAGSAESALKSTSSPVRASMRARGARVFVTPIPSGLTAQVAFFGALLRARAPKGLDRAQLLADAERSLQTTTPALDVRSTLDALSAALESTVELPRLVGTSDPG